MITPTHRHTRGRWYRRPGGPWDGPTLDLVLSTARPRDELVFDGGVRLSSVQVNHLAARVAGGLRAAGIRRRDPVAWQLPNRWEVVVLYRACWRIGAVAVPLHPFAGAAEVDAMLAQAPPHLVVDADRLAALLTAPPLHPSVRPARPSDPAVVLFTSGTSGPPKAVVHTHRGLAHKARLLLEVHKLRRKDAVLVPAPLSHVTGLVDGVLVPGAGSLRTILQEQWDPDAALALIERERVTYTAGPPSFLRGLREAAAFDPARVASLRLVSLTGAGVTSTDAAETADALDARVKRTYGSTEAPVVTTAHAGDPKRLGRSTDGRATGEVELRLDAATGEILVRGPELFAGYTDPAMTAGAFVRGGWYQTGDLGSIDADGWLTITARLDDVIVRDGVSILAAEVEAHCEAHPAVRRAVAVGVPDEDLGQRVAVALLLGPGVPAAEVDVATLGAWFDLRGVDPFAAPEQVVVVPEMPTLPAGTPDRRAVRKLLLATPNCGWRAR